MPLTKPIPELQDELRRILLEDLAAALTALRELLPENGERFNEVLSLQGQLKDANKERIRNTIGPEEYQRRVDTIRANCLDMISALTPEDFETSVQPHKPGVEPTMQGSVLYRVPERMPLRKPSICTIRVAIEEDALFEDIVLDENVQLRQKVEVSEMMKAELLDPEGSVFQIRALSAVEQLIRETGYTQWLFNVTPQSSGEHQLLIKVSMLEFVANLGRYIPREISILETVTIIAEAQTDAADAPLKPAGYQFAVNAAAGQSAGSAPPEAEAAESNIRTPIPAPNTGSHVLPPEPPKMPQEVKATEEQAVRTKSWGGKRSIAAVLLIIFVGSGATYALTPAHTRDWWWASWQDDAQAYETYIAVYQKEGTANPNLEKAYYLRAARSERLADLRAYQQAYRNGIYETRVTTMVRRMETADLQQVRQSPSATNVRQFLKNYPESENFDAVKQAVDTRMELRKELATEIEAAHLSSIKSSTTPRNIEAYLREYPDSRQLNEVTEAASKSPEVFRVVKPRLETRILQQVEKAKTAEELKPVLPAVRKIGDTVTMRKVEELIQRKSIKMKSVWGNKE